VTLKSGDDTLTVTQGNQTVQIKAGASSLEAMQSILLKVGNNSIKIAPDGITIKGMLIDIQGSLGFKAKGLTADVLGDAALTLKGGIAKIN
jgi:type VI secretion system secreted protein VgrG